MEAFVAVRYLGKNSTPLSSIELFEKSMWERDFLLFFFYFKSEFLQALFLMFLPLELPQGSRQLLYLIQH